MQEGVLKVKTIEYSKNKEVAMITCLLEEGNLDFEEGQFVTLETIQYTVDHKHLRKPYSIASTHNQLMNDTTISFIVKKASEDGMSSYLTQWIKIWDQLKFQWPLGHMTDNRAYRKYLFVSIGSWLGPLYAHYKHLVQETEPFEKIVNLFGEKTEQDLVPSIKTDFEVTTNSIQNKIFISRQETVSDWLYLWHVQDKLPEALTFLWDTNFVAFLCGKPQMVADVKQKLLNAWLEEKQIKLEMY